MSIIDWTARSIPACPGITADAGGAALAPGAAQAAWAIAIGLGQALNNTAKYDAKARDTHLEYVSLKLRAIVEDISHWDSCAI